MAFFLPCSALFIVAGKDLARFLLDQGLLKSIESEPMQEQKNYYIVIRFLHGLILRSHQLILLTMLKNLYR